MIDGATFASVPPALPVPLELVYDFCFVLIPAGFAVLAVSIAIASVVGRFHYALDAITGLLLALCVWGAAVSLGS